MNALAVVDCNYQSRLSSIVDYAYLNNLGANIDSGISDCSFQRSITDTHPCHLTCLDSPPLEMILVLPFNL